jgi:hypothetical protein
VVRRALPFLLLGVAIVACGSTHPPPSPGTNSTGSGAGAGAGTSLTGATSTLPGCGATADGTVCECVEAQLFEEPPNLYFVLDRSGSMATDNKWDQVRLVVSQLLRGLGPRVNVGATVFPGFQNDACAPPAQVLPLSKGDARTDSVGPATTRLLNATAGAPSGGTPTAEALRATLETLRGVAGKTYVVLATDGGPNCNASASCGFDQCIPNIEDAPKCPVSGPFNCCSPPEGFREACLDSAAADSAVRALSVAGIPVYVVGLPGTATYGALLDRLATTGGTALAASPRYYRVEQSTSDALLLGLGGTRLHDVGRENPDFPEDDAVMRALGASLALASPADCSQRLAALDRAVAADEELLLNEESRAGAAYADLRIAILERWPVLDDPWHPDFGSILERDEPQILDVLDSAASRAYRHTEAEVDRLAMALAERKAHRARVMRLHMAYEGRRMRTALRRRGGRDWEAYRRLITCERRPP